MVIRHPPGSRPGSQQFGDRPGDPSNDDPPKPAVVRIKQWHEHRASPCFSTVVQPTFIINAATRAWGTSATVSRKALANVNLRASCCTGCLIRVTQWPTVRDLRNWAGNDEPGNHLPPSDTLVVTDRSSRRRWVIIGAVLVIIALIGRHRCVRAQRHQDQFAASQRQRRRADPDGYGDGPRSDAGRARGQRERPARGQARSANRDRRARRARDPRSRRCRQLGARWAGTRHCRPSVQAEQAAQLAAQIEAAKANAAWRSRITSVRSRCRAADSCPRPRSMPREPRGMPRMRRCVSPRLPSARRVPKSDS